MVFPPSLDLSGFIDISPKAPAENSVVLDPEDVAESALVRSLPAPDIEWKTTLRLHEETTRLKTECKNPVLRELIEAIDELKQENRALSEREQAFTRIVQRYAVPLMKMVQYELFQLIHSSEILKERLNKYLMSYRAEDKEIDVRDILHQLEREAKNKSKSEVQDEWMLMIPGEKHQVVNLDYDRLKELSDELALIQSVIAQTTSSKNYFMQIDTIRKKGHIPKPEEGWDNHYESAVSFYTIISGLAVVGRVAQAVSPALCTSLKLLFPGNALTIISILINVLTAAAGSGEN